MFKTKWQKKYERAMEHVERMRQYYEDTSEMLYGDRALIQALTAQKVAANDILSYMKQLAEEG